MNNRAAKKRSILAHEVVQTSAMDRSPASLKCLLEGFGISVSYGRLREACQTNVDGTSIDTIEEVACQLGLDAEQVMVPLDHLLLPEAKALPAIAVTRNANGTTHFVVIWRRHGAIVQVMDPATGRRWPASRELLKDIYLHAMNVGAQVWREWAGSENFLAPLNRRLTKLGLSKKQSAGIVNRALEDETWRALAALDAAARMTEAIIRSGAVGRGQQATTIIKRYFEQSLEENTAGSKAIPENYWLVRPAAPDENGEPQVQLRGAVLVSARGRKPAFQGEAGEITDAQSLSPELTAALAQKRERPLKELFTLLRADGVLAPALLSAALALAAGGVIIEALLFQSLFELSRRLNLVEQRIGAMALLMVFVVALLLIEAPLAASFLRMGRKLETRLRLAFLKKIPRLSDRYFQSRLISDMAERSHTVQMLRTLPTIGGQFVRLLFELMLTSAGIIWLNPAGTIVALVVAVVAVSLPLLIQSRLTERDLRIRNHNAALGRFYLDALLGLVAVRTHGAEQAVRREHESLLVEWMRASIGLVRAVVTVEALQSLLGFGLAALLLVTYFSTTAQYGGGLLLVYWSLNLPVLGEEIAQIVHQYPLHRNITLRIIEPLGAPEETEAQATPAAEIEIAQDQVKEVEIAATASAAMNVSGALVRPSLSQTEKLALHKANVASAGRGVRLTLDGVSVRAAGHVILEDVNLEIEAGTHIAIVGPSGAGKSSLAGLLLGWHKPASGEIRIDGERLDAGRLEQLRKETAWVDPAVQLWNRSLLENLSYGAPTAASMPINSVVEAAQLRSILEKLPDGFQTKLGESGSLLSGGEGQRVRLGRAMRRGAARLVILDEAFRGVDRQSRCQLLARARKLWQETTLLCITHDVSETQAFERVLVVDAGRLIEDGDPADLLKQPGSRYRQLIEAEDALRREMWASNEWRRIRLEDGQIIEDQNRSRL